MRPTLPVSLLFAGAAALPPLAAIVRRPTSAPRLVAKALVAAPAVIALIWPAWLGLLLIEQGW